MGEAVIDNLLARRALITPVIRAAMMRARGKLHYGWIGVEVTFVVLLDADPARPAAIALIGDPKPPTRATLP
jgi:hypothetical protein